MAEANSTSTPLPSVVDSTSGDWDMFGSSNVEYFESSISPPIHVFPFHYHGRNYEEWMNKAHASAAYKFDVQGRCSSRLRPTERDEPFLAVAEPTNGVDDLLRIVGDDASVTTSITNLEDKRKAITDSDESERRFKRVCVSHALHEGIFHSGAALQMGHMNKLHKLFLLPTSRNGEVLVHHVVVFV